MQARNLMTTNVVTIPSNTSIAQAKRIMQAHRFGHLPVVDKGKLVGILTERRLESVSPSKATSLTYWELGYLLEKTKVKEIMEPHVITVSPDMTAEESLALAQAHGVSCVVVVEDERVEGIITANDFVTKFVNPILGLGDPGVRLRVIEGGNSKALEKILSIVNKLALEVTTLHTQREEPGAPLDVVLHINSEDVSHLIAELQSKGYSSSLRPR